MTAIGKKLLIFFFSNLITQKYIFLRKYQKEESGIKLEGNGKRA